MDIHDLQCFRLAYETKSIARAAEQAFLTRQALSRVLRNLETEIRRPLFIRTPQGLEPTEIATSVYPQVSKLLNDYIDVRDSLTGKTIPETVHLCVALGALNSIPLDEFMNRFSVAHPAILLDVDVLEPSFCEHCVSDGVADLGLIVGVFEGSHTSCTAFSRVPLYAGVHESLLPPVRTSTIADLKGLTWFGLSEDFPLDAALINYSKCKNLDLNMVFDFHDYHLILDQVRQRQGVCMVPEYYLGQFCTEGMVSIPFDGLDCSWELSIIVPRDRALSRSAQLVRDAIMNFFA